MSQKVLLSEKEINIILHRLACQLLENHLDFANTVLIGIQPRGTFVAERLTKILKEDEKTSHIPILILTALSSSEAHLKGLKNGVDMFLTKPFNLAILNQSLKIFSI